MVLETITGADELLLRLGNHPGEFIHVVTSPAGTTIEGIYRMEREGIRGALMKTIQETYFRALQIQKNSLE
ncbi:MAG: pyrroline-5-carboxylate reductase, partial [Thermotogae bacterium]